MKHNTVYFREKNFRCKYFRMIYVNDCSIRVVRSFIKILVQVLHTKIILQRKKANYGT